MAESRRRMPGEARKITPRDLSALPLGKWIADPATADATALEARRVKSGVAFYFRFQTAEGKRDRLSLGRFDAEGVNGLTVAQAREEAARLTDRVRAGGRDLRGALEADALRHRRELEAEAARLAAEEARQRAQAEAATAAEARSLGKLAEAYVQALEARGAKSAASVAGVLRRSVAVAFPVLWRTEADALTVEDLLRPVAALVKAGKLRQAAALRSHLSAAYAAGLRARTDPAAPEALRELRIASNPARDLATVRGAIRARDRALSAPELAAYWRRVQELEDPHRSLLTVHLLTGAQRVEQLARATVADWDRRAGTLTLRDPKGRRELPRVHVVPTLPPVAAAIVAMRRGAAADHPFVWTLTHGKGGCSYAAAHDLVSKIAAAMVSAGEAAEPFTVGDLRRSVETLLAGCGVPLEVRAQLQSHGLGGLQARHYDRHAYAEEKAEAVRLIWALCDPDAEAADRKERERLAALAKGATVLQFRRGA
jgi:hypothetical protein